MPSGLKPGSTAIRLCRLPHEQQRSHQQHQGKRHLRGHQARRRLKRSRPAVSPRPPARIAAAGAMRVARRAGTSPNSRQVPIASAAVKPEHAGQSRPSPTNIGLSPVLRNAIRPRLSACASTRRAPRPTTASSRLSASNCAHQPAARRADSLAHADLALPHAGPRQQQVRQVGAGDQQHQPGGGQQQPQRLFIILPQAGNAGGARRHLQLVLQILLGSVRPVDSGSVACMMPGESACQCARGPLSGPSRLQPAHRGKPPGAVDRGCGPSRSSDISRSAQSGMATS